jgi:peptidoglycan/LPS O-acetylase OafA/YrhL
MGLALWLASGTVAFAIARFIPRGRSRKWLGELVVAWIAALLLGVAATALDFGGWGEPDPRAGLACGFAALAIVGILRVATHSPRREVRP